MGWKPIETAPRDGTIIAVVGYNFGDKSKGQHALAGAWSAWFNAFVDMNDPDDKSPLQHLTHWMPLPEPPK